MSFESGNTGCLSFGDFWLLKKVCARSSASTLKENLVLDPILITNTESAFRF
jgi:hypothetical protein